MTVATRSAREQLAGTLLDQLSEPARRLARVASLAVRVQPDLLRALRVGVPGAGDVGTEADVLWSDIVASRGVHGVTFSAAALRLLRGEAKQQYQADPAALAVAAALVRSYHHGEPPSLQAEERIVWAVIRSADGDSVEVEAELDRVLASLVNEQRTGLADWWLGAWSRLPDLGRKTEAAGRLNLVTSTILGQDAIVVADVPGRSFDDRLILALAGTATTRIGVRRDQDSVWLEADPATGDTIESPTTNPLLVSLEWRADAGAVEQRLVRVTADGAWHRIGTGRLTVRTALGDEYELTEPTPTPTPTLDLAQRPRLGAHYDGAGTAFAVLAPEATAMTLSLFDGPDGLGRDTPMSRLPGGIWYAFMAQVQPGQCYGYRVSAPDQRHGHPSKLLLDPYARAVAGDVHWGPVLFDYEVADPARPNYEDSASAMPKSVVINPFFDWGVDAPRRPLADTVIYEAHVKGMTALHPRMPAELRGTYAGLAQAAVTEHLRRLGVTAVQLLPVQHFLDDTMLAERGLSNYWGYSPISLFAPAARYAASELAGAQVTEFKSMVRALHVADLEVILDIDLLSTAEGAANGPVLSLRGLGESRYYRMDAEGNYLNLTGTGNTLDLERPAVQQLVLDALRYWVQEMHVDGFRFATALALGWESGRFRWDAAFFTLLRQDPILREVKLIADSWVQPAGYGLGVMPAGWSEENVRYREDVRDAWRGAGSMARLATAVTGSPNLYEGAGKPPQTSVNLITSHEGFTLADLVSYNHKHNEANGENNQDGVEDNRSFNCGVEGPTADRAVVVQRARQQRNLLTTLFLSAGVPLLSHGDELGRTQQGNNNNYGQDNELSWLDWSAADEELIDFVRILGELRHRAPALRRRRFSPPGQGQSWYRADGEPMAAGPEWADTELSAGAVVLSGRVPDEVDGRGRLIDGRSLWLGFNLTVEPIEFRPSGLGKSMFDVVVDTAAPPSGRRPLSRTITLEPRSIVVAEARS